MLHVSSFVDMSCQILLLTLVVTFPLDPVTTTGSEDNIELLKSINPNHKNFKNYYTDDHMNVDVEPLACLSGNGQSYMPTDARDTSLIPVVGVPSSSKTMINRTVSGSSVREQAVGIVEDNFYRSKRTGIRISIFHANEDNVRHLACLHGVPANPEREIREVSRHLIHHLVYGHCYRVTELIKSINNSHQACKEISSGFSSVRDLSDSIVDSFLFYIEDMSKLPPAKLSAIIDALDYPRTLKIVDMNRNNRRDSIHRLRSFRKTGRPSEITIRDMFSTEFESNTMSTSALVSVALSHGIELPQKVNKEELKDLIVDHLIHGRCMNNIFIEGEEVTVENDSVLCGKAIGEFFAQNDIPTDPGLFKLYTMYAALQNLSLKAARRLGRAIGLDYELSDTKKKLKKKLSRWLHNALKGKTALKPEQVVVADELEDLVNTRINWPQTVSASIKERVEAIFKQTISKRELTSVTCASCTLSTPKRNTKRVSISDIDLNFLKRPDLFEEKNNAIEHSWLDPEVEAPPMPFTEGPLKDVLVEKAGVSYDEVSKVFLTLCNTCLNALKRKERPALALSNRLYMGTVPPELQELTVVEEAMIACCRASCWIVQLKEDNKSVVVPTAQRGFSGHVIIYPQNLSAIAQSLPPTVDKITSPLCVIFVGANKPTEEWLREKATPLAVRGHKVRNALIWLKTHNRYYKDIEINEGVLQQLEQNPILPFHIEHVVSSTHVEEVTSRYDNVDSLGNTTFDPVAFQNVVISDVNNSATFNDMSAAAFRHVKKKGKGYLQVGRESRPVDEFDNPSMLPMCYPSLFPYGIGGSDDPYRDHPLSLKRHVKLLFSSTDQRFQRHYSFLFTVFNILQRREMLLRTFLKAKKDNFANVAARFAKVSPETIHIVSERVSRGDTTTANTPEENQVLQLMKEVKAVTVNVPGSVASKIAMRNEIRALILDQGLPHFFLTINPADVYHPLVKFLAGSDIDIDMCVPSDHNYQEQAFLVSRNPAAAARFFNLYMKAFIRAILGYEQQTRNRQGGILGKVKAYYGTVEAQGRGTLHCHMMVWLEGGMNPDDIKKRIVEDKDEDFAHRLVAFLDDSITNERPTDPDPSLASYHPCTVCAPATNTDTARKKDKYLLVERCQYHTHSKTCYKYDPHRCRFELDEQTELHPITTIDDETGEVVMRCLHGLVNNFNETMLRLLRCNMDIKYIGSGASAKAVTYYVTDYITKSQLKAHVAYAALELAVKRLGEFDASDDDITVHAKKLLQRCAYVMISHQEMSAQQVASSLMDFEDHFTSHNFANVFWTSFEAFVNTNDESPECYSSKQYRKTNVDVTDILEKKIDHANKSELFPQVNDTATEIEDENELETINEEHTELNAAYDDEVILCTNSDGDIIPKTSVVEDYIYRGEKLSDLSVWDYFSRIEKIRKNKDKKKKLIDLDNADTYSDMSDTSDCEDDCIDSTHETIPPEQLGILWDLHYHCNPLLTDNRKNKRPRIRFTSQHSDEETHRQKIRLRQSRLVPVPIGPPLPRRDREDSIEKHARLMLILFKPWTSPLDLRESGRRWSDEYSIFLQTCDERFKILIKNMQVLHECRDERDDHFANRANQARHLRTAQTRLNKTNHLGDVLTEDLLHEHLQQIKDFQSDKVANVLTTAVTCLDHIESSGFLQINKQHVMIGLETVEKNYVQVADATDNNLELLWQAAYDDRKVNAKQALKNLPKVIEPTETTRTTFTGLASGMASKSVDVLNVLQTEQNTNTYLPAPVPIVAGNPLLNVEKNVDIKSVAEKWNLNKEQTLAFRLIVEKSLLPLTDPLRLIISGQGGTGKSRVILAITDYFQQRNQSRRMRLASYTGIAARNINGTTLHAALSLSSFKRRGNNSKSRSDLVSMWQGVDYLFIDEFSMIGCRLLYDISRALSVAKENPAPFGGINVIFAGDFAQLPPIGDKRLYSKVTNVTGNKKKKESENDVLGKLMWMTIRKVVILKEVFRQKPDFNNVITIDEVKKKNDFMDLLN